MATLDFDGKSFEVDDDGYLIDWEKWSPTVTTEMAKQDGLELTEAHWEFINFLREYFKNIQLVPMFKTFMREFAKVNGKEKGDVVFIRPLIIEAKLTFARIFPA